MKVAIYARVSTDDREQDPETQLLAVRDYCALRTDWAITGEYVDQARARDLRGRREWRRMMDAAARKRFAAVVVFKLDRAFRSVRHMHATLEAWEIVGVDLVSVREQFDTSTAMGRLLMNLMGSLAEFELEVISERVKAGMNRARREGKQIGRPQVEVSHDRIGAMLADGHVWRDIAEASGVSVRTARRVWQNGGAENGSDSLVTDPA